MKKNILLLLLLSFSVVAFLQTGKKKIHINSIAGNSNLIFL